MAASSIQTNFLHGTVLERYTNELTIPEGFKAPVLATNYERKSNLWNVAAKATFIAYTILSASVLLTTGILAPVYVPLTGICTWLGLDPVYKLYAKFQNKSEQIATRAEQLKAVAHQYQQLQQITTQSDLQDIVNNLLASSYVDTFRYCTSIPPERPHTWHDIPEMKENPENLKTLKPAIAWYRFWEEHIKTLEKKQNPLLETLEQLSEDHFKNHETIDRLEAEALEIEKKILELKVRKAFAFLIIVQPSLTKQLDEIGHFSNFSLRVRVIENDVTDISLELFKFKNRGIYYLTSGSLTFHDVKHSNIPTLAKYLFESLHNRL